MALIQVVSDMEPGKRGNCHPCLLPPWLNPDGGLMGSFSTQQPPLALRCLWAHLSPFGLRLLPEGIAFPVSGGLCSTRTFCQIHCSLVCDV